MPLARDLLDDAVARLAKAGVPSPQVDAELLLAHVTGQPRALLRMAGRQVTEDQAATLAGLVAARCTRRPLQHLTGRAPFRHLELAVGPGVFIPRPETEMVVDSVLAHLGPRGSGRAGTGSGPLLVDLCAGSGALALALATEVPGSRVIAVEISPQAVGWLERNLAEHRAAVAAAGSRVDVVVGDATHAAEPDGPLTDLCGGVDVVVSNPPYVPDGAVPRDPEVRDHDPGLALFGGPDGLDVVRPLARQAARLLHPGGLLVLEHADAQGEDAGERGVPAVLRGQRDPAAAATGGDGPARPADAQLGAAWVDVRDHRDLAGLPRCTTAIRAGWQPDPDHGAPSVGGMRP